VRSNGYDVSLELVPPRAIAAVRVRVAGSRVSSVFRDALDQVYAAARHGAVQLDGQNVFVYRSVADVPDEIDVDFGVGTTAPFARDGSVVYTVVPGGHVATATHWGDYGALGAAHDAIIAWCRSHDLRLAGPRWEVYGHWQQDATPRTDVYYLTEPRRTE